MDAQLRHPFAQLLLSVADDKLVLGHRNSDWTGLGPILEEDIAFSSIAQDEIAHASAIYDLVAPWLDTDADALAFGRAHADYRCASIVELPDEFDWATAITRQLFCDHFDRLRLERLGCSSHEEVAALFRRLAAEEQVHVEHADGWIARLGDGTEESRKRIQAALTRLAPHAPMLFEAVKGQAALEQTGLYPPLPGPDDMFERWRNALQDIADRAGLALELVRPEASAAGGRRGEHTDHLGVLLDEMTEVYRIEPGVAW